MTPLFGIGLQGKSPSVTAQTRLNLYYEFQPEEDRTRVAVYGTPGLELFVDFGDTGIRGLYPKGDYLYAVHRGTFWQVDNAGTKTSRGTLNTTTGMVDITDNGLQIMITDGTDGYIYTIATATFAEITDVDYLQPSSCAYLDTYFISSQVNTNKFQISASNNGAAWDSADFANAESNPDNIVRGYVNNSEYIPFGDVSTEFWVDTGAADFPFARIAVNEWGLAAKFSVAKFDNTLIYLARNRMGEVILVQLDGYNPVRISTSEWEFIVNNYTDTSSATAFAYMLGGHPMYQINFSEGSWLYDGSTGVFSQLKSYGLARHRADTYAYYIGQNMVGDYLTGRIYKLKDDVYSDNGDIITRQLRGKHVFNDEGHGIIIDELQFFMQSGVGLATGQGSNPQAMLRISKDGGQTYGNQMFRSIGKIGQYLAKVVWRGLGMGTDWIMELTITDPVKVVITDTYLKYRKATA